MEMNAAIVLEKIVDLRCLVCRQVVEDDVNLLAGRAQTKHFFKKATKSRLVWRAAVLP
jgi:hypothetical protein